MPLGSPVLLNLVLTPDAAFAVPAQGQPPLVPSHAHCPLTQGGVAEAASLSAQPPPVDPMPADFDPEAICEGQSGGQRISISNSLTPMPDSL